MFRDARASNSWRRRSPPVGDGFDTNDSFKAMIAQDPHIKFFNNQRGYVRHVVTPERWQADFQVLDKVSVRDGRVSTRKSFVVEHGRNGLAEALTPGDRPSHQSTAACGW